MDVREKLVELFYDNNVRCDQKIEGLADDVMDIIDNGVTIQKWIPVTERLPEKEGSYLVYSSKSKSVFTAHYRPSISEWANRANGQFITHWMPLTEPPKGE